MFCCAPNVDARKLLSMTMVLVNVKAADLWLKKNKTFFDTCLKYPLDQQQRKAIIADEDDVLVVSSAGSGLHHQGKSIKYISNKMGRSQTSIIMRLGKLGVE